MTLPLLPFSHYPSSTTKPINNIEYMHITYDNIPPPPTYNVAMRVEINKLFALRNNVSPPPGLEPVLVINLNQVLSSMRHPSPPCIDTVIIIHLDQIPINHPSSPPGLEPTENILAARSKTAIHQWLMAHPPPKHIPPVPQFL